MVLIDSLNSIFMAFSMAKRELKAIEGPEFEFTEKDLPFFYHILLNKYHKIFKTFGRAIICHEGEKSLEWRRSIFPGYKINRDKSKQEEEFKVLKSSFPIIEELLTFYPAKQIKQTYAEADDIINILAQKYAKDENVMIISSDKDLTQIMKHSSNISVYNPLKNKEYEYNKNIILEKAIIGDRSDGIPGLYRIGEKTLEKMLSDPVLWKQKIKGNEEILKSFYTIIDLDEFPQEWRNEILYIEENTEWNEFNPNSIELFLFENKLEDHLMKWSTTRNEIINALN